MFPYSSFTRGEATPRDPAGARTPVRTRTPVHREESPTIADTAAPIAAVKAMDERPPTPDYKKAQYLNMSSMSSW
ncbi:hypothetical protein CcaverHIS002_0600580 [Cutaneotrichosporon cavernicola]|uniref:Uncharacterized protein n=1 Tax=Cutaneotrichosporon cavernicola TaxID=279322 RepID=A0AA48L5M7_9TREE|nr:uncharacterized protein CcaverHIS019_0500670 [Cutaneotrichosporon cavernicola]BEI85771.1 hypothetical protein CcaverHIS002_0600580 [Cutaneotrichosporon cavernicola]BEI92439.1 hypothetical protein CcaverHIS019_0500670 [Cutaneotrichosporon cavernicola]BEJ00212.1 hypothetical protein CcaverHIS631_0500690 [Cutaneotrichosporon cavernicola]BEJ07983.1 hypothetical protein CcaverHIS641_0500680 [Cutaneotrichosporon cavernicola]